MCRIRCWRCWKITTKAIWNVRYRRQQSGPQPGKAGRDRPIVIMLDPGHGGEDSGAVGKYRTREKDVVLQIARRSAARSLSKEGNMKVYMTRNEDVFIPLKVRVAKAQKQRADLFVSIHADAFTSRQPSGSSVFALSTKGCYQYRRKIPRATRRTPRT